MLYCRVQMSKFTEDNKDIKYCSKKEVRVERGWILLNENPFGEISSIANMEIIQVY